MGAPGGGAARPKLLPEARRPQLGAGRGRRTPSGVPEPQARVAGLSAEAETGAGASRGCGGRDRLGRCCLPGAGRRWGAGRAGHCGGSGREGLRSGPDPGRTPQVRVSGQGRGAPGLPGVQGEVLTGRGVLQPGCGAPQTGLRPGRCRQSLYQGPHHSFPFIFLRQRLMFATLVSQVASLPREAQAGLELQVFCL